MSGDVRVLVTNDDGIDSPGLAALAAIPQGRGHDTIVAAPGWDSSGSSASVTGVSEGGRLKVEVRRWAGWSTGAVLAVDATPALICRAALEGVFGPPPDVVLSGINRGLNTGRAILHSGTVGAAFTATAAGRPALAVSLGVGGSDGDGAPRWATAVSVAARLFDALVAERPPTTLNCNVPGVPLEELRGIRPARLAAVGAAQSAVTEAAGAALPVTVGTGGASAGRPTVPASGSGVEGLTEADDTDVSLLAEGYATITAVVPVVEDPGIDLTAFVSPPAR